MQAIAASQIRWRDLSLSAIAAAAGVVLSQPVRRPAGWPDCPGWPPARSPRRFWFYAISHRHLLGLTCRPFPHPPLAGNMPHQFGNFWIGNRNETDYPTPREYPMNPRFKVFSRGDPFNFAQIAYRETHHVRR